MYFHTTKQWSWICLFWSLLFLIFSRSSLRSTITIHHFYPYIWLLCSLENLLGTACTLLVNVTTNILGRRIASHPFVILFSFLLNTNMCLYQIIISFLISWVSTFYVPPCRLPLKWIKWCIISTNCIKHKCLANACFHYMVHRNRCNVQILSCNLF